MKGCGWPSPPAHSTDHSGHPSGAIRRFSTAGTKDSSSGRAIVSEPFGARRLHLRRQPGMAREEPDAGVPAQHRVVVARRAQRLRFLVVVQRFEDPAGGVARMRTVPDLRLDPALADQASVVLPLVVVEQPAEDGTRVAGAFPRPAAEMVCGLEKTHELRCMVIGLVVKGVEAVSYLF